MSETEADQFFTQIYQEFANWQFEQGFNLSRVSDKQILYNFYYQSEIIKGLISNEYSVYLGSTIKDFRNQQAYQGCFSNQARIGANFINKITTIIRKHQGYYYLGSKFNWLLKPKLAHSTSPKVH